MIDPETHALVPELEGDYELVGRRRDESKTSSAHA
jgi:hypothetical protein